MNKYIIILIVLFLLFWKKTAKNPDGLTAEQINAIKDDAINNGSIYDDETGDGSTPTFPNQPILAINLNEPINSQLVKPVKNLSDDLLTPVLPVSQNPVRPPKGEFLHADYNEAIV